MAVATLCQTPGAIFHTAITPTTIALAIDIPGAIDLGEADAAQLEADLHNAAELVLARWWPQLEATMGEG